MKIKVLVVSMFLSQMAFAYSTEDLRRCGRTCDVYCDDVIEYFQDLVGFAQSECSDGGYGGERLKTACIKFILDKSYGTTTAKDVCSNISNQKQFSCLKNIMGKAYGPTSAVAFCKSIITAGAVKCSEFLLNKGYGLQTCKDICANMTRDQAQCLIDVMNKGYGPSSAKETCSNL